MNYALSILNGMSEQDRQAFVDEHGPKAFRQLWNDAHSDERSVPPLPADLDLGESVMRREAFEELDPKAQMAFVREKGGTVIS